MHRTARVLSSQIHSGKVLNSRGREEMSKMRARLRLRIHVSAVSVRRFHGPAVRPARWPGADTRRDAPVRSDRSGRALMVLRTISIDQPPVPSLPVNSPSAVCSEWIGLAPVARSTHGTPARPGCRTNAPSHEQIRRSFDTPCGHYQRAVRERRGTWIAVTSSARLQIALEHPQHERLDRHAAVSVGATRNGRRAQHQVAEMRMDDTAPDGPAIAHGAVCDTRGHRPQQPPRRVGTRPSSISAWVMQLPIMIEVPQLLDLA